MKVHEKRLLVSASIGPWSPSILLADFFWTETSNSLATSYQVWQNKNTWHDVVFFGWWSYIGNFLDLSFKWKNLLEIFQYFFLWWIVLLICRLILRLWMISSSPWGHELGVNEWWWWWWWGWWWWWWWWWWWIHMLVAAYEHEYDIWYVFLVSVLYHLIVTCCALPHPVPTLVCKLPVLKVLLAPLQFADTDQGLVIGI